MFPNRFESLFPSKKKAFDDTALPKTVSDAPPKFASQANVPLVLNQFRPAWDVQTYARFAKIKLHIQNSSYPEFEATGPLPQLRDGHFLVPRAEIIPYLQSHHKDLDANLTADEKSQVFAFRNMVHETLYDVLLYSRFVDKTNYSEITSPAMAKIIPFPLNNIVPRIFAKNIRESLVNKFKSKDEVFVKARDCYTALNDRLDSSTYFFGDHPSSLDAIVFGHLVDALSDLRLRELLVTYAPNLVKFARRIRDAYYGELATVSPRRNSSMLYTTNCENQFNAMLEEAFIHTGVVKSIDDSWISKPYKTLSSKKGGTSVMRKQKSTAEQEREAEDEKLRARGKKSIVFAAIAMGLYLASLLQFDVQQYEDFDEEDEEDYDE